MDPLVLSLRKASDFMLHSTQSGFKFEHPEQPNRQPPFFERVFLMVGGRPMSGDMNFIRTPGSGVFKRGIL